VVLEADPELAREWPGHQKGYRGPSDTNNPGRLDYRDEDLHGGGVTASLTRSSPGRPGPNRRTGWRPPRSERRRRP
jgi:hypothetical protein